jgi:hypothetical protein
MYEDVKNKFSEHRRFTSFVSFDDHFEMMDKKGKGLFISPSGPLIFVMVMEEPEWDYLPYEILSKLQ